MPSKPRPENILAINDVFGKARVVETDVPIVYPSGHTYRGCICICECQNAFAVVIANLRNGKVTGCGCGQRSHKWRKGQQKPRKVA